MWVDLFPLIISSFSHNGAVTHCLLQPYRPSNRPVHQQKLTLTHNTLSKLTVSSSSG